MDQLEEHRWQVYAENAANAQPEVSSVVRTSCEGLAFMDKKPKLTCINSGFTISLQQTCCKWIKISAERHCGQMVRSEEV